MPSLANLKGQRSKLLKKIADGLKRGGGILASALPQENLEGLKENIESEIDILKDFQARYEEVCEKITNLPGNGDDEASELEGAADVEIILDLSQVIARLSSRLRTVENKLSVVIDSSSSCSDVIQEQLQKLIEPETAKAQRETSHTGQRNTTVNLPKLDFYCFAGDILKWREFWDSFAAAVDLNPALQSVQKLAYLRAKLQDEAKSVIAGLETTNDNYSVAISLLRQRYGDDQSAITAHYMKIMDLAAAPNHTEKLRHMCDTLEQHLRCLASLGEDVNHRHFISLIMAKLPKPVIMKLEEMKGPEEAWTVDSLRNRLSCHLSAREAADRQGAGSARSGNSHNSQGESSGSYNLWKAHGETRHSLTKQLSPTRHTTEALLTDGSRSARGVKNDVQKAHWVFCKAPHWSDECTKFSTVAARKRQLNGRCFNCLSANHSLRECTSARACWHCHRVRSHHRSLCAEKFSAGKEASAVAFEPAQHVKAQEKSMLATGERVLLQTAVTEAFNAESNERMNVRILFDTGSNRTYMTEETAKKLRLKSTLTEIISVTTFAATKARDVEAPLVDFSLKLRDGSSLNLKASVIPQITGTIERGPLSLAKYDNILSGLKLADTIPEDSELVQIDILIGTDYYLDLLTMEKIEIYNGFYLLGSKLGWLLTGRLPDSSSYPPDVSMYVNSLVNQSVPQLSHHSIPDKSIPVSLNAEDFWSLETIGINDTYKNSTDAVALDDFKKTVCFEEDRYQVAWSWRDEFVDLPENFELAFGRLKSLLRRLSSDRDLLQKYDKIIQNQLSKRVIEKVNKETEDCATLKHYIPHHCIVTPQKTTTKVRIVYDASAKARKGAKSLNECLLRGPVILENLCGLLMRFRLHKVALIADIEKAFLQVGLQPSQRDVTRFLWLQDSSIPSVINNLQIFRFSRVPFGVISSPFLLAATVSHHLELHDTPVSRQISENMYVDNMITGVSSSKEASEFYKEAKSLFYGASMNGLQWTSNDRQFLAMVEEKDRAEGTEIKVLGMNWNTAADSLSIAHSMTNEQIYTKRDLFKNVASFFDPLGLFSPVLIRSKVLLQTLWQAGFQWDDRLEKAQLAECETLREDLKSLRGLSLKRFIGTTAAHNSEYYLFCFCDASCKAYATTVYLGCSKPKYGRSISLVFAKTRLAPIKSLTIPRLELLALLIGTRSLKFVEKELRLPIAKRFLWSDSQCVLQWLTSKKSQGVFVENRLKEIRATTNVTFNYVDTHENPADMATRGVNVSDLMKSNLWWHGPYWLEKSEDSWPNWKSCSSEELNSEKQIGNKVLFEASLVTPEELPQTTPYGLDANKYSSLSRLLRVTAWCSRFISGIRKHENRHSLQGVLSVRELKAAKLLWELYVQKSHFAKTHKALLEGKTDDLQRQLDLWLHEDGLLHCGGRLLKSDLPEDCKFPKLIPKGDPFTLLVIKHFHEASIHSGVAHTLAKLRAEYWLPQGRRQVRQVLSSCRVCKRWEGGPYFAPKFPCLPKERVTRSKPFTYIGIDYFGPFWVKIGRERKKVWTCLFTCMAIRAIHLEPVEDLSTNEFLLCLRRYISRRGTPACIYCDNAANFTAAKGVTDHVWKDLLTDPDIQTYIASKGIQWHFIIKLAPWMGGYYERLIGLVKRALRKAVGRVCLSSVQLSTILMEVEAAVNTRPLTYVGEDFKSGFVLTPGHFLSLNTATRPSVAVLPTRIALKTVKTLLIPTFFHN